jgi:hypothetical protein
MRDNIWRGGYTCGVRPSGWTRNGGRTADAWYWMHTHAGEATDAATGIVSATRLAEAYCEAYGVEEWLEDEGHWVWQIAADVATARGGG